MIEEAGVIPAQCRYGKSRVKSREQVRLSIIYLSSTKIFSAWINPEQENLSQDIINSALCRIFLFLIKIAMLKTKTQKLIVIIILLLVCSVLIRIYKTPEKEIKNINTEPVKQTILNENTLPTEASPLQVELKYESADNTETNVYDFMSKMQKEGKIDFKYKEYSGMGKFIEEINGIKNENKNWIYYVNNIKADVGVSNYKINNGDIVSWKYE